MGASSGHHLLSLHRRVGIVYSFALVFETRFWQIFYHQIFNPQNMKEKEVCYKLLKIVLLMENKNNFYGSLNDPQI